ncbi:MULTISPECIES: ABC transporter permease [unclassified Chelatococcus]|uniref:ABC transporter permease n=1 Tax=unclassified Chelatococcus TaxID=2638111 RepID=UPI001BCC7596|nr:MULTISPECIES: ABC transporter permease [unclassified Chelatococcus]MBS7700980.1 ABC transporter permease [Chelatococcus sp. YT9]MBX3555513.1 ABC transporter permease [Chelatococcus sp.]
MAARQDNGIAASAAKDMRAYANSRAAWPSPAMVRLLGWLSAFLVYLRSMAVFLVVWHLGSMWVANPILLPSPLDSFEALLELFADGEIFSNVAASLSRLAVSFGLALICGIALGFAMGLYRTVFELVDPLIELLRPISGIAWIPLGMFILGVGEALPTAIMFYGAFFPIVINTVVGVTSVNPGLIHAARVLGVNQHSIVRHVVLPAALPNILVGARLGAGAGWMAMVAAELIGAPSGLGFAIEWYRELLMTPKVLAFVFIIGLLGYLFDRLLRGLQSRLTPWSQAGGTVA